MENKYVWVIVDEYSASYYSVHGYEEEDGKHICGIYESEELAVKEARAILRRRKKLFKDLNSNPDSSFDVRRNALRNKHKYVYYSCRYDDGSSNSHHLTIERYALDRTLIS